MGTCTVSFVCPVHGGRRTTANLCSVVPTNPVVDEYELRAPCLGHVAEQRVDEDQAVALFMGGARMTEAT